MTGYAGVRHRVSLLPFPAVLHIEQDLVLVVTHLLMFLRRYTRR